MELAQDFCGPGNIGGIFMGLLSRVSVASLIVSAFGIAACNETVVGESSFKSDFSFAGCTMTATGRNPYFVLEPGFQLVLEDDDDKVEITVLDETKVITGITARVVEEREWKDGKLYEVARNYFAMC